MPTGELVYLERSDKKQRSLVDIFHRLNNVIPDEQKVITVTPKTKAKDALKIMFDNGFSQLPVVEGKEVLGVFSFRSYSRGVQEIIREKIKVDELLVDEFIESVNFSRVTDEFRAIISFLDKDDVVIAGESDRLQGVVTALDVLRYLYKIASPFVLLTEIELALRGLIQSAVDNETLRKCVKNCLKNKYDNSELPNALEDMDFNDYVQIIGDGRNWAHFEPIFLGNRKRTRGKLKSIRNLRNIVFHFKREMTVEEYDDLQGYRDWLLRKSRSTDARLMGDRSE